jgi:phage I-like protein
MRVLLVALRTPIPAPASAGDAAATATLSLPDRIIICPWGTSTDLSGKPVIVGQKTLAQLAANQAALGYDEIALDFEHNTYAADENGKPIRPAEPIKVAAYGTLSVVENEGIIFTPTSWTPEGSEHFAGRHYRDLSPTVGKDENGEVIFIHSVALTRHGQIPNLHAYSSQGIELNPLSQSEHQTATRTKPTMDPKTLLLKLLGLPEDATDEQIIAAADKVALAAAEPKPADAEPKSADPEVTALHARLDAIDRALIVREATAQGKIIPLSADEINTTPVATLKALVGRLEAKAVPMGATAAAQAATHTATTVQPLSAEQQNICRLLRIDEPTFRKRNNLPALATA